MSMMADREYWRVYMDIDQNYYALAGVVNAVNDNTIATGNFKKRPKIDPWPTPQVIAAKLKKKKESGPKTVKDLYRMFMNRK